MKQTKKLKRIHKLFLTEHGLKSQDYRLIDEGPDYFEFLNIKTNQTELYRR